MKAHTFVSPPTSAGTIRIIVISTNKRTNTYIRTRTVIPGTTTVLGSPYSQTEILTRKEAARWLKRARLQATQERESGLDLTH